MPGPIPTSIQDPSFMLESLKMPAAPNWQMRREGALEAGARGLYRNIPFFGPGIYGEERSQNRAVTALKMFLSAPWTGASAGMGFVGGTIWDVIQAMRGKGMQHQFQAPSTSMQEASASRAMQALLGRPSPTQFAGTMFEGHEDRTGVAAQMVASSNPFANPTTGVAPSWAGGPSTWNQPAWTWKDTPWYDPSRGGQIPSSEVQAP